MKKICSRCLVEKNVCEFHKHKGTNDGRYSQCKECRKVKSKNDYHKNKENDKLVITGKTCSHCFIEKDINLFHKQIGAKVGYRSMCKECRRDKFKKDYHLIVNSHRERAKNYRINNREKYNKYYNVRYINYPHIYAWRSMLASVLRRMGTKKEKTTYELLGYSSEDLKIHMESLFVENMCWDNWGEWHIDHIKPISKFNVDTDPKIVNSLSNLQPLWAEENMKKSNK
jgi:hypothetical protein